ncbi:MAG: ComF family protein [Bacteroidota bacterium]
MISLVRMVLGWHALRSTLARSVFGQECVLCAAASGERLLCEACTADLPQVADACPRCAGPSPGGATCGACTTRPPSFDATLAPWRYEFPVDRLVLALKFGRRLALAEAFGAALAERAAGRRVDALVPMPLGRARLAERGFNQALEIARHLARLTGIALAPAIAHRVRDTAPQTGLPHDERAANVRGAFACDADGAGRTFAVIDDVMTTGASLEELARTLKHAGAARVENWVVARTWPRT